MNIKNIIYSFACLSFAVVIGGAVYEHVAVVPRWSAAPPVSLSMFQGAYGLNPEPFWKTIHPVTLLLMITTLILFWKTGSKPFILATLAGYAVVLIITFIHFVPELIAITRTPFAENADKDLTARAQQWELLSLVRLCFLVILAVSLFLGLTRQPGQKKR